MANGPSITVQQSAAILNSLTDQMTGAPLVAVDLSNIVDTGKHWANLPTAQQNAVLGDLVSKVTEQSFRNQAYKGNGLDLIRSTAPYEQAGGVIEIDRAPLVDAVDDPAYNPVIGASTAEDVFRNYGTTFNSLYYHKKHAYMAPRSLPERWFTGAFLSPTGFSAAINAIETSVQASIAMREDANSMACARASIIMDLNGGRTVHALTSFNAAKGLAAGAALTADKALGDPEFLRHLAYLVIVERDRMTAMSGNYNLGKKILPNGEAWLSYSDPQDTVLYMLSTAKRNMEVNLQSDTYHKELVSMGAVESVVAWQGTGAGFDMADVSTVKGSIEVPWSTDKVTANKTGVIATLISKDRIGIHNYGVKTTSQYDPVGLKTNMFTHVLAADIVDPFASAATFVLD